MTQDEQATPFGRWLRSMRLARNWSLGDVAERSGLSRFYILRLERGIDPRTGKPISPTTRTIKALAKAFEIPEEEVARIAMGRKGDLPASAIPLVPIPVLGRIHAGRPDVVEEQVVDWIAIPEKQARSGYHFGLVVHGDCMAAGDYPIHDGSYVVVRQQDWCNDGDIAVVLWPAIDEAQVRRVYHRGSHVVLRADNPSYPPEVVSAADVRIIGVVVGVYYRPNGRPAAPGE